METGGKRRGELERKEAAARERQQRGGKAKGREREPVEKKRKLSGKEGRSRYALRKQTVEPVFGIIKGVMRFRRFLMRGAEKAAGEWNPVCCSYNIKRLFSLLAQPVAPACAPATKNRG
ncbi:MAG: transposase [Opitutales bacterium]